MYSTVFPHAVQQLILYTELILQEILQLQGSSRVIPCHPVQISTRHLPATVSRVSKHSTRQNKAPSLPTAFQGHIALAGFQQFYPVETALQEAASIHAAPTATPRQNPIHLVLQESTWYYRILPGEIGFIPKGLSIVCQCNTKVSVFQFTCYKNINSIQSSSNSMRRYNTLSSIQVILVAILHKLQ